MHEQSAVVYTKILFEYFPNKLCIYVLSTRSLLPPRTHTLKHSHTHTHTSDHVSAPYIHTHSCTLGRARAQAAASNTRSLRHISSTPTPPPPPQGVCPHCSSPQAIPHCPSPRENLFFSSICLFRSSVYEVLSCPLTAGRMGPL